MENCSNALGTPILFTFVTFQIFRLYFSKAGDFQNWQEGRSHTLKSGVSCLYWESWNIWFSHLGFFLWMQQRVHGDCTEPTPFVCKHIFVSLNNPFSGKAVCCIHHPHRKHEPVVSWVIALAFFWEVCASIPFLCFSSLTDQIKYSETLKYSEQ